MPLSAEATLALACARRGRPVVCVSDGPQTLEMLHRDLLTLRATAGGDAARAAPLYYPALESPPSRDTSGDADLAGHRLRALQALARPPPGRERGPVIVATCIQALMQKTLAPEALERGGLDVAVGRDADLESLTAALAGAGYLFEAEVVRKTQASLRGGILDVWPPTEPWPLRVEFFGPTVESIRAFNPADQRSVRRLDACRLPPARERTADGTDRGKDAWLFSYLPPDAIVFWSREADIRDRASICEESAAESGAADALIPYRGVRARLRGGAYAHVHTAAAAGEGAQEAWPLPPMRPLRRVAEVPRSLFQPDITDASRRALLDELRERAASGQTVLVLLDTPGALAHFREMPGTAGRNKPDPLPHRVGILSEGFLCDELGLAVAAESDLYGRRKSLDRHYDPEGDRRAPARFAGDRVADLSEIEPGDLVVHEQHGIGRYLGLNEIRLDDRLQEVLTIEYADNARLHVPVAHAALLSRYVGTPQHKAALHRLGGRRWAREKTAAEKAVADFASRMLETQARRSLQAGHAFSADTAWQHEFETAFPFRETTDQQRVIAEIKRDMENVRPMDRLVCGDAGYGKTEAAMRAAFKTVMDQRQVAVLVPTTVLAQQHYETFTRRMAPFPVRIEMLSRFCAPSRRRETLAGLRAGTVDIVIGTHALVQPGIAFARLGLLIIDEEQRFGVEHKEALKQSAVPVDILTLSATPIPRTLYMSLTGVRDMSLLQTPPLERVPIETVVARHTDDVVRHAVLREINREGQVFFLHNRVMTVERVRQRLERVVPEARIAVAHGRMAAGELAAVMHRFIAGSIDLLLCTTIIESGMDIPRANTILIDRADRFGMADLYQLRGRVGRSNRKAYAYLLLPGKGPVDAAARKRIQAIERYSGLSAGFGLALRDLEMRGAGNMLGAEQSGHIAAVGFGLYCQMLRRAAASLKGEPPPAIVDTELRLDCVDLSPAAAASPSAAFLPAAYVEDERLRVGAYRKFAECAAEKDVDLLREELRDRFGPPPPAVERLLRLARLRVLCAARGVRRLETRDGKIMMTRHNEYVMSAGRFPRLAGRTADENLAELMRAVKELPA